MLDYQILIQLCGPIALIVGIAQLFQGYPQYKVARHQAEQMGLSGRGKTPLKTLGKLMGGLAFFILGCWLLWAAYHPRPETNTLAQPTQKATATTAPVITPHNNPPKTSEKTPKHRRETTLPAGRLIVSGDNAHGNFSGINYGTQIYNDDPPAKISWRTVAKPTNPKELTVYVLVSKTLSVPAFVATCESACDSLGAFNPINGTIVVGQSENFRIQEDPRKAIVLLTGGNPVSPGNEVIWTIQSGNDRTPVIKNIEALTENDMAKLPTGKR